MDKLFYLPLQLEHNPIMILPVHKTNPLKTKISCPFCEKGCPKKEEKFPEPNPKGKQF